MLIAKQLNFCYRLPHFLQIEIAFVCIHRTGCGHTGGGNDGAEAVFARGAQLIGPDDGPLAEGESGPGRMAEPAAIVAALGLAR